METRLPLAFLPSPGLLNSVFSTGNMSRGVTGRREFLHRRRQPAVWATLAEAASTHGIQQATSTKLAASSPTSQLSARHAWVQILIFEWSAWVVVVV